MLSYRGKWAAEELESEGWEMRSGGQPKHADWVES